MSSYALIHEQLIRLGVKPQLAHKIARELIEKSRNSPSLSKKELNDLLIELSNSIEKLGDKTTGGESKRKQYLHAVVQGLIATGLFELLVLSKAWLSTVFNSIPSESVFERAEIASKVRIRICRDFSSGVSFEIGKLSIQIEQNRKQLIKAALTSIEVDASEELVEQINYIAYCYASSVEILALKQLDYIESET